MCNENNKIFRSIIQTLTDGQTKFNFSLDLSTIPAKYIELISYGIHEKGTTNLYTLNINKIFESPLICHSAIDHTFLNFSHGLIFSVNEKNLNGLITCDINPSITIGQNESCIICLYFVIHY